MFDPLVGTRDRANTSSPDTASIALALPPNLRALVLRFDGHADRTVHLNEHKGSAIRGALFHALRGRPELGGGFCVRQELTTCHPCDLHQVCPISALVATVSDEGQRGIDPPRPFTIEPPLDDRRVYAPDDRLEFGVTLFGEAIKLLPYVVSAVRDLRRVGLGHGPPDRRGGRGTFVLDRAVAVDLFAGTSEVLLEPGLRIVQAPAHIVTGQQVAAAVEAWTGDGRVSLELLTPLRLTMQGQLVRRLAFRPLIHRLVERCLALHGGEVDTRPFWPLVEMAEEVRVAEDRTRWVELESYSTRRNARAPLSGLVGEVTFEGNMEPFLPWLIWGQITHVGKEATKGNGWYRLR
jgi:hypothetical protein